MSGRQKDRFFFFEGFLPAILLSNSSGLSHYHFLIKVPVTLTALWAPQGIGPFEQIQYSFENYLVLFTCAIIDQSKQV
jgi:hypothetical protein